MKKILVFVATIFLLSALVLAQQGGNNDPGLGSNAPDGQGQDNDNGAPENTGQGIGQDSGESNGQGAGNENSSEGQGGNPGTGQGEMNQTQQQLRDGTGDGSGNQLKIQNKERLQTGLQNALGKVKNEVAKRVLQQNMEMFQQKYELKLQKMQGFEVDEVNEETGEIKLKAKEEVKFLGFIKGKATRTYNIDVEGNINEKKPWYRFMYKGTSE
ncbi:hypothetical protein H8D36_02145 [archaeon]|nr:hypothetical protein [archaeon]